MSLINLYTDDKRILKRINVKTVGVPKCGYQLYPIILSEHRGLNRITVSTITNNQIQSLEVDVKCNNTHGFSSASQEEVDLLVALFKLMMPDMKGDPPNITVDWTLRDLIKYRVDQLIQTYDFNDILKISKKSMQASDARESVIAIITNLPELLASELNSVIPEVIKIKYPQIVHDCIFICQNCSTEVAIAAITGMIFDSKVKQFRGLISAITSLQSISRKLTNSGYKLMTTSSSIGVI